MIVAWMVYATFLASLLGLAALLLERGCELLRLPTRWLWATTMVAAVTIPAFLALSSTVAPPSVGAVAIPLAVAGGTISTGASLFPAAFDLFRVFDPLGPAVVLLWIVGSALTVTALLWSSWQTRRRVAAWNTGQVAGIDVLYSTSSGPAVIGALRGKIVLPRWTRRLTQQRQLMIVTHEAEHLRANDTAVIAFALTVVAFAPWNVFLWWQFARLRHAIELDCDRRVLRHGIDRYAYSRLLIELTEWGKRGLVPAAALASRQPLLSRRVTQMLEQTTRSRSIGIRAAAAVAAAAVLIVIGCSLPTPPDDRPEDPVPKVQLAEAREAVAVAERALAEHTANAQSPLSAEDLELRSRLEAELRRVREVYHSLVEAVSGERHIREADGVEPELHFKFDARMRHKIAPLVYVDGVRVEGGEQIIKDGLDPDQIERVEILKGGAAARLHGQEAAGGVIHITTKHR